jgi:hypothetical protein
MPYNHNAGKRLSQELRCLLFVWNRWQTLAMPTLEQKAFFQGMIFWWLGAKFMASTLALPKPFGY